jgi:hypothetical protein
MERRKVIKRLGIIIGGLGITYSGFKFYELYKHPYFQNLEDQRELIAALADTIIPATDSPGAGATGTAEFIIKMIRDCTERKAQNNFISGLNDLAAYSHTHYNKNFPKCSLSERNAILTHFETINGPNRGIVGKAERKFLGDTFFTTLKKYTVIGYCTSKIGATQALAYDYIPGKYIGSVPLTPNQKAWATR